VSLDDCGKARKSADIFEFDWHFRENQKTDWNDPCAKSESFRISCETGKFHGGRDVRERRQF
jgi:hypothetical protein